MYNNNSSIENTKTGEKIKEKVDIGPNIVADVTVQVTNKGLKVFQKVMNKNNDKPKS